jgi:hypothetical protein
MEDLFGLEHLGYAGQVGLQSFGADVFDGPATAPATTGGQASANPRPSVAAARDPAALPATGPKASMLPALGLLAASLAFRRVASARRARRSGP